jgi:hypothetical protein
MLYLKRELGAHGTDTMDVRRGVTVELAKAFPTILLPFHCSTGNSLR